MAKVIIRFMFVLVALTTLGINSGIFIDSNFKKEEIEKNDKAEDTSGAEKELDFEKDDLIFLSTNVKIFDKTFVLSTLLNSLFVYSENCFCSPVKDILSPPPKN
jgi:hypothetical protein